MNCISKPLAVQDIVHRYVFFISILFLVPVSVVGGPPPLYEGNRDISSLIQRYQSSSNVPALAGAVIEGDGIFAFGAAGHLYAGSGESVGLTSKWHLGSNTKAMTATLVAILIEDHVLNWETKVGDVFVDIDLHPDWSDVTVLDLLRHRSGAQRDADIATLKSWSQGGDVMTQRADFAKALLENPVPNPKGEFSYSNSGYILTGAILEKLSGNSWEELMVNYLFNPLGMAGCGFNHPPAGNPVGHKNNVPSPGEDLVAPYGPASAVHCDLESWGRFIAMHLNGPDGKSNLLPASALDILHTPVGEYAAGWNVLQIFGSSNDSVLNHYGSNGMWYSTAWISPETNRAFLVVTNTFRADIVLNVFSPVICELVEWNAQLDVDNDGIPDSEDKDNDNDGLPDDLDLLPLVPLEFAGTDQDGTGNND